MTIERAVAPPAAEPLPLPASIYLLADHLDAALAAGEDLMSLDIERPAADAVAGMHALQRQNRELGEFLYRTRALELSLVARLLQARERTADLLAHDNRFRPQAKLFLGGTALIADAARTEIGPQTVAAFASGDRTLAYLKSRGVLAADALTCGDASTLRCDERFILLAAAPLGVTLDTVASFLDGLDHAFDLYSGTRPSGLAIAEAPDADADAASPPVFAPDFSHAPDVSAR